MEKTAVVDGTAVATRKEYLKWRGNLHERVLGFRPTFRSSSRPNLISSWFGSDSATNNGSAPDGSLKGGAGPLAS